MPVTINGTTGIAGVDGSASAPAIQGGDTNTGVFFPAADTVSVATGGVERTRVASDGSQSSVISGGSTLYPEFKCRAWVNFNGSGTIAIRASGNVSSLTDNGAGDYTVNFSTSMPDTGYSAVGQCGYSDSGGNHVNMFEEISGTTLVRTTSSIRLRLSRYAPNDGAHVDSATVNVAIFR